MTARPYTSPFDPAVMRQYHASVDAYASARLVTLENGAERGVRVIEMRSGGGLEADIVVDRSFDIGRLSRDGETLSWHTGAGNRHPALIDANAEGGQGYLRGLSGLLSTCGFDHIRQPETEPALDLPLHPTPSISYPLHGMGAHQPAQLIGYGIEEKGENPRLWCEGEVIQSMLYRGTLRLRRRIEMSLGGDDLSISDHVENIGPHPAPVMMLYHFNLGYPLVDHGSTLRFDPAEDLWSSAGHDPRSPIGPPATTYESEISVHRPTGSGMSRCQLVNPRRGLELTVAFDRDTLPFLQLLRLRGAGYYMVGIEPCTAAQRSRAAARDAGQLPMLQPGEGRDFRIELTVTRTSPLEG